MTVVHVQLRFPDPGGADGPALGRIECTPTLRRAVNDTVVLPAAFSADLVNGDVDVDLAPSGVDWCWRIREVVRGGTTRYVAVPDVAEIGYEDLVDVDPDTLDPTVPPSPVWDAALTAHSASTTNVHGIADIAALETTVGAQAKATAARTAAEATAAAALADETATRAAADTSLDTRVAAVEADHATATQGAKADTAVQPAALVAETAAREAADLLKVDKAPLSGWPITVYGNSYGVLLAGWFTAGGHYSQLAAAELGAGAVTSYAVGAERSLHSVISMIGTATTAKFKGVVAGATWPGVAARPGLVVLDVTGNDIGHYPSMAVPVPVPSVITSANTNYRTSMRGLYRTMLAVASSASRIEQTAATFVGAWTQASASTEYSSGSIAFSTAAGASIEFPAVTPPQSGPLAGKVFLGIATLNVASAPYNVSIDGGTAAAQTAPIWENYTGANGAVVNTGYAVLPVTLPVDGAAHSVKFTHGGAGGQAMYADCLYVASTTPPPIAFMGMEHPPLVHVGIFDQAGVNAWRYNMPLIETEARTAVAEFSNAFYVPSTMTSGGLYSGDGLHPNDRGMAQRAIDLATACQNVKARLSSRALALVADDDFGIV